jgi:hypothetical protein
MLRVNYSLLKMVEAGNYEEAVEYYKGRSDKKPTQAMQSGSYFDKLWEDEVKTTGKFPVIFGGRPLEDPKTQVRLEKIILPWLTLHGKPDLIETQIITDYKTGVTPATSYAASHQHQCYQILLPDRKYFDYWAYNQYARDVTMQRIHLTEKTFDDGLAWIVEQATTFRAVLIDIGEEI